MKKIKNTNGKKEVWTAEIYFRPTWTHVHLSVMRPRCEVREKVLAGRYMTHNGALGGMQYVHKILILSIFPSSLTSYKE